MGEILVKMYDIISGKAGLEGRIKFAEKIGIPKSKALDVEDTPDLLNKCKKIASDIIGQDITSMLK